MSLFSGFSTAGDEERAIRLSRAMTDKSFRTLARVVQLHRPIDENTPAQIYEEDPRGEPIRACNECGKPWPCPTWETAATPEAL